MNNYINMEPQIIDYYNELPQSVNVIDKLNEEYDSHLEFTNLSELVCYPCKKCESLCNNLDWQRDNLLLCRTCNPYHDLLL